jgi:hypothetical protein
MMKNLLKHSSALLLVALLPLIALAQQDHDPLVSVSDQFELSPLFSLENPAFEGRVVSAFSDAEGGAWLFALDAPVVWAPQGALPGDLAPEVDGQSFNILEWSGERSGVVDAYVALDDEGQALRLDDLVFDRGSGWYVGLDRGKGKIHVYAFEADRLETILEDRVRLVEVPGEKLIAASPEAADVSEESETGVADSQPDEELIDPSASPSSMGLDGLDEGESGVANEDPSMSGVERVGVSTLEETVIAVEDSEGGSAQEPVSATEVIAASTWREEVYQEAVQKVVRNRFGRPVRSFSLDAFGFESVDDLSVVDARGTLALSGVREGRGWIQPFAFVSGEDSLLLDRPVAVVPEGAVRYVFVDPISALWVVAAQDVWSFQSSCGRLVRSLPDPVLGKSDDYLCYGKDGDLLGVSLIGASLSRLTWERTGEDRMHWVPGEFPTLQAAVNRAADGDWVLLSPGSREDVLRISGKSIKVSSLYAIAKDPYFIENTGLSPGEGRDAVVLDPGAGLELHGVFIRNAGTAVRSGGTLLLANVELRQNRLGVALVGGQFHCLDSEIAEQTSHGLFYEDATASLVERCNIRSNGGDGIHVRITPYDGVLFRTVLRRNEISGNLGSGIHFEDAPVNTQREFRIENNFILKNAVAGVRVFLEQPDPKNLIAMGPRTRGQVFLVNNTLVGHPVGIWGGGNFRMVNNIISGCSDAGLRNVAHHSVVIRNLFWDNRENAFDSNFDPSVNRFEDPLFVGSDYILSVRSPAKRAGIPGNLWNDTSDRSGADIGASH